MSRKKFDPKKLLKDLKKGNIAATEFLFKQHHKVACQYIYHLIHDLEKTEVIYFQVFRQLLLQIDSFNSIEEIRIFILDAITEASLKFLQDGDGETIDTLECGNLISELTSSDEQECKRLEAEVLQEINDLITTFPPKEYYVIKFYYFERVRNKEVAEVIGVTPQDVYKLRKRCAERLKKIFDKQDTCRQYYWLFFLSERFKTDAGIDTE